MAKQLKIKIKNTQLAKAAGLGKLKAKLSDTKEKKPKEKAEQPPAAEPDKKKLIRAKSKSSFAPQEESAVQEAPPPKEEQVAPEAPPPPPQEEPKVEPKKPAEQKLGPTGRHINDILPAKPAKPAQEKKEKTSAPKDEVQKKKKVREFKDLKPAKRGQQAKGFNARDRAGLSVGDDSNRWRKRRGMKSSGSVKEEPVIRPSSLKIRLPILVKDLAAEMKLKASELIQKLFLQGMIYTLNDYLDDETTVSFLGSEFGCEITIDTTEEERIQITSQTIAEEVKASDPKLLTKRPPIVTFMGHVDHGKTSLIDSIRNSNLASGEAGAITQHIGAFKCHTSVGDLTILDTPGHEAFSAMRARGAEATDIVVLVVAGDEGLRAQTKEAIEHAKNANVTIVVAVNKLDKPNFNADNVYRELSEVDLLPEAWGGQTITVNTSAVTGDGVPQLLEMLSLQAEVLELNANSQARGRGTVLESEMHKGMGSVATVLVQNGTLKQGDALVFENHWGRVKTMMDEHGKHLSEATPSTPVEITGLSGVPSAGDPFIVVKSEKEAKKIVETRRADNAHTALMQRKIPTLDKLMEQQQQEMKVLRLILRADVQGSVEALKTSLQKIKSDKAEVDIIFTGVGEISESDIQLAATSNATIIGFHSAIESHAENLIKTQKVTVRLFDVIYHAVDEVKLLMTALLDKLPQDEERGEAEVKVIFKASQLGNIAGCLVTEGTISRNHLIRVIRDGEMIWKGSPSSIKRVQEDVKEVKKGIECGILLNGFNTLQVGDILQAYEVTYLTQEL